MLQHCEKFASRCQRPIGLKFSKNEDPNSSASQMIELHRGNSPEVTFPPTPPRIIVI